MEDLLKIKRSLRKNMDKLISVKQSIASKIEGSIEDVNKLLKMLKIIEDKLNVPESTLQLSDSHDQGFKERVEHVLFLLESFLPGDQMKGKAKILEEENNKEKPMNLLEQLFKLLKEEEKTLAMDQIIEEQQNKWILFKNKAFKDEEKEFINNQVLLEIATKLFNKYYHNPILLEKIATLFSSKHTMKEWEACYGKVLETLGDTSKNNPFHLMELINYEQLHSNIKICLCYCSLFPKDYLFNKTDLMHLWASQENLLTAATNLDAYFGELLNKGYFFEITQDDTGDTLVYKMHYLVNEFLKEIAKPEFCLVDEPNRQVDVTNILHLSLIFDSSWTTSSYSWISTAKKLRSLLFLPRKMYQDYVEVLDMNLSFTGIECLRALDLVALNCETILSLLGELEDLRYLRLGSLGKQGTLPKSVIRLKNLQTLDLRHSSVWEMPLNFHKFRLLENLYVGSMLIDMPPQISKLESLNILDEFVVGKNNGLEALDSLKLAGKLTIRFDKEYVHREALKNKNLITDLSMVWSSLYGGQPNGHGTHHFLQPPPSLKSLAIRGWKRERLCDFTPPKSLVSLCIEDCSSFKFLPNLSGLPYLRSLQLWDLKALEYIENGDEKNEDASVSYFPSLNYLLLANLHELKGWSRRTQEKEIRSTCLQLRIKGCPKMMSMPRIPNLESLETHNIHKSLLSFLISKYPVSPLFPQPRFPGTLSPSQPFSKTMNLEIISIILELDSTLIFGNFMNSLTIKRCPKLKELYFQDFQQGMNSLQQLVIHDCNGLQNITGIINVSSLQVLEIKGCEKLKLGDDNMKKAWEDLQSLHTLKLIGIPNLASLENGLMSLKKLEKLSLHSFYELKSLPEWMRKLTQLQGLAIRNCPYLITLPESFGDLSALQQLHIQCCPLLEQIPGFLTRLNSLQQLKIQQCPKLFERYHKMGDQEFLLKAHIDLILLE